MVLDMGSDQGFGAARFDAAITPDDVVIADAVGIATGAMPFVDLGCATGLVRLDGRAVDY